MSRVSLGRGYLDVLGMWAETRLGVTTFTKEFTFPSGSRPHGGPGFAEAGAWEAEDPLAGPRVWPRGRSGARVWRLDESKGVPAGMANSLVLTVIGSDQPGLVEAVAQTVAEHGGSWESSRMARLAGYFAGILEVRVPGDNTPALFEALHALESRGLRVIVEEAESTAESAAFRTLELELVGQDRPGIIRDISAGLAAIGVNVAELSTECTSAPMSGEMLFKASALLHLPTTRSADELRAALEKIAADLMVDIALAEAND